MKVAVLTSDNHSWLLKGFFLQWAKYSPRFSAFKQDPLQVEVVGFSDPGNLPENVKFHSVGDFVDYPVTRWSDGLIKYLNEIEDDLVIILLEDYWMMRQIDRLAIVEAAQFMSGHPEAIRFDIAADRMFSKGAMYLQPYLSLDVCEVKGDYSLSFQASIYRRKLLLEVMKPGETPWQAEISGSGRLNALPYRVFGSYQWPMNYQIMVNKGKVDPVGGWMYPARRLLDRDYAELFKNRCFGPEAQS